ncbi:MAG: hypothetical protein ACRDN8_07740 [Thermoleophilaceae bacterium]
MEDPKLVLEFLAALIQGSEFPRERCATGIEAHELSLDARALGRSRGLHSARGGVGIARRHSLRHSAFGHPQRC